MRWRPPQRAQQSETLLALDWDSAEKSPMLILPVSEDQFVIWHISASGVISYHGKSVAARRAQRPRWCRKERYEQFRRLFRSAWFALGELMQGDEGERQILAGGSVPLGEVLFVEYR